MKKEEKIKEMSMSKSLVLSYGETNEISDFLGVFEFSNLDLSENSKENKKVKFVSSDSNIVFTKLDNESEKIMVPVKDWIKICNGSDANSNNFAIKHIIECFNPSNKTEYSLLERLLSQYYLMYNEGFKVDKNYSLYEANASYVKDGIIQGLNYSITPIKYCDYDKKEKEAFKTMK